MQNINEYLILLEVAIKDKISGSIQTEFEISIILEIIQVYLLVSYIE